MDEFNNKILSAMLVEITAADDATCALRVRNLVEQIAKLARHHWNHPAKEGLWDRSQPIWREIRDLLERQARCDPQESTRLWLSSVPMNLENIAFLAWRAILDEDQPRARHTEIKTLKDLLDAARQEGGDTYRAIQVIVGLSLPKIILQKEELPPPFQMSDVPADRDPFL